MTKKSDKLEKMPIKSDKLEQKKGDVSQNQKLYPSLSSLEISMCIVTWVAGVMYSFYNLHVACRNYLDQSKFLGLVDLKEEKDVSDYEWRSWKDGAINCE